MWQFGIIVLGILIFCFYRYFVEENGKSNEADADVREQQEETSLTEMKEQSAMEQKEESRTKQLALRILRQIGCQPEETEEGRIRFEYQGIVFLMEAIDECLFVNLIWPWCHNFSKFDIDEFARVRQVVNDMNMQSTVSVFYGISDSDEVALHIKKNFLFVPEIPKLDDYLKLILDSFFRTARTLDLEIEKSRLRECEKSV